jgi:hypothetical protein
MRSTKRRRRALSTASKSRFHISSPLSTLCKNNLIWLPDLYMRSVFYPIFPFFLSSLLSILLLHFLSLAFPYDVCTTNKQTNKHIGVPFYYHRLWLIYNVLCFIHTYPSSLFHVPDLLRHTQTVSIFHCLYLSFCSSCLLNPIICHVAQMAIVNDMAWAIEYLLQ